MSVNDEVYVLRPQPMVFESLFKICLAVTATDSKSECLSPNSILLIVFIDELYTNHFDPH